MDVPIAETGLDVPTLLEVGSKSLGIEGKTIYLESGDELTFCGGLSANNKLFIHDNVYYDDKQEIVKPINITIVGPGGVGKSAITLRIMENTFDGDYNPTIEDLFEKIVTIDGCRCKLNILDTAGQEDFKGLREGQMKGKDGYIFCYSLIDHGTFDDLESFYDTLIEVLDVEQSDMKPMILCGNKCDFPTEDHNVDDCERHKRERIWKASKQYLTSAKSGHNIRNMLAWLVRDVINDLYPVRTKNNEFDNNVVTDSDNCVGCSLM